MVRRRKPLPGGEEGLGESLLGEQQRSEDAGSGAASASHIIPYAAWDLQAFLSYVYSRWLDLLEACLAQLRSFIPGLAAAPLKLSGVQAARLDSLGDRLMVAYDPDSAAHQARLRRLWELTFATPCAALKSPQWKEMGWQGNDPATDFRSAGKTGLDCLIYLAETYPEAYRRLKDKVDGPRSDIEVRTLDREQVHESSVSLFSELRHPVLVHVHAQLAQYPFAAAGVNLTHAIAELLDLRPDCRKTPLPADTRALAGFLRLLGQDDNAFEEVYCAAFELLDAVWLEAGASYMQFNAVLKTTRQRLSLALAAQPADVEALRGALSAAAGPTAAAGSRWRR